MTYKPDVCIYHGNCADGFTAAWAVWKRWPGISFHAGIYGQEPPYLAGRHVLIVDFSYKRRVLKEMSADAATITILDHHKTAQADLETFAILNPVDYQSIEVILAATQPFLGNIRTEFDMNRSGAMMAWQFCHPGTPAPRLLEHIQDRDLWRFALPHTREVQASVFSYPYSFDIWDGLVDQAERGHEFLVQDGEAIERKHFKDIAELLGVATRIMTIGGHQVPVANLPYTLASDAAHQLAKGQPFGACYMDMAHGRVFSLRSGDGGIDVSDIAKAYGGGGHATAAGFTMPIGWEGDVQP